MTALLASGISAGYGPTEIVRDVQIEVADGEIVCILGRNGVGKSTLLKSLLGLVRPTRGDVSILGRRVSGWPTHRIIQLGVGYGPQELPIFQELTVAENLTLGDRASNGDRAFVDAINSFPTLKARLNQRAGSLSGGEQKMLVFVRALLGSPRLIILDEVVEGVQPTLMTLFADIVRQRNEQSGTTFLIVEQNVHFALSLASRFVVMKAGGIVDEGEVNDETQLSVEQHLVL